MFVICIILAMNKSFSNADVNFFFLIAYFTPDVIGEPLTNMEIPYVKVFGICPTLRGVGPISETPQ